MILLNLNVQLVANFEHGSFVIIRQACTDVNDRDVTLLQIQQQTIHFISMYSRQAVNVVHNKVIAVSSELLTLDSNH